MNKPSSYSSFRRDYVQPDNPSRPRRHSRWMGVLASVASLVAIFFVISNNASAIRDGDEGVAPSYVSASIALPAPATPAPPLEELFEEEPADPYEWQTATVKKGDSLAAIFSRMDLSARLLHDIMQSGDTVQRLKRIMPGQEIRFAMLDDELHKLTLEIDPLQTIIVDREDNGWQATIDQRELESRVTNATGVINNSLFLDAQRAGLSEKLIMELAGIFGWDIDFVLDLRVGDKFTVLYEELYLDGRKVKDGNIIAAEFINQGRTFRAVRYTDPGGHTDYYAPDGRSMRKAFIRSPVDFTRISSKFGKRYHPVLNRMRSHHGVDYAAGSGTPIKAAGDGKIVHRGRKGGYGHTIIIQHGSTYSTLYAHMSKFRGGLRVGSRVKQGQVIGYVGMSGLATGPHLHYEFRVNGVHRNPLTVDLPEATPISPDYKTAFVESTRGYLNVLDVLSHTEVALNE